MKKETGKTIRELGYFASLGISVALSIFIGLFIGIWLDKKFDTEPVLLFLGLAFGIAAGFSNILRAAKKGKKVLMQDLQKIVNFVTTSNWLILLFGGMIGLAMTPMKFALGIILGGLIVAINFHLLKNTLKNMFRPEVVSEQGRSIVGNVLIKYYIRFAISGGLIFLLISKHIVHPLGLLAGLSVVVASMFAATILELTRLFFKEAV